VDPDLSWYSIYNDCLGNRSADLHDRGMPDGKVRDDRNFRQKRAQAARPSAPFELPYSTHHIYDLDASSVQISEGRFLCFWPEKQKEKVEVDLGVEPSSPESESGTLNRYTDQPYYKKWKQKVINVGVESKTLALLAPRSNQLS
jgi:hypothetical protein